MKSMQQQSYEPSKYLNDERGRKKKPVTTGPVGGWLNFNNI